MSVLPQQLTEYLDIQPNGCWCWTGLRLNGYGRITAIRQRSKTHCPQNHAYDGDNLYVRDDGRRCCRACGRDAKRKVRS